VRWHFDTISELESHKASCNLHVYTLGQFVVHRDGLAIPEQEWGREKTVQLFQFFVANLQRAAIHREQISNRIWEDDKANDFKVALHGINKALEPNRPPRTPPTYLLRQGHSYQLDHQKVWIDTLALENFVAIANSADQNNAKVIKALQEAVSLYHGVFLPDRIYEDWSAEERERIQVIVMGAYYYLAELQLSINAMETIRLSQNALNIDPSWEDLYRLQMIAYIQIGNRPQAIKTYQKCKTVLDEDYGLEPLPKTSKLLSTIRS